MFVDMRAYICTADVTMDNTSSYEHHSAAQQNTTIIITPVYSCKSTHLQIPTIVSLLLLLLLLLLLYQQLQQQQQQQQQQYILDITGIRGLPRKFRNSSLFTANCKTSPSARCVSAANRLCKDVDIFRKPINTLKQILS